MTLFGLGAAARPASRPWSLGLSLDWLAFDLLGLGLLVVLVLGFAAVARPVPPRHRPRDPAAAGAQGLAGDRVPDLRQPRPAHRAGHRGHAARSAPQRVRTVIPKLRGGERGTRAYRLPTTQPRHLRRRAGRGHPARRVRAVPPLAPARRRPSASGSTRACSSFRTLPTGPDPAPRGPVVGHRRPQGNITFHRLREYVRRRRPAPGALALVGPGRHACWSSTTSTPRSRTPSWSSTSGRASTPRTSFEEAVDVAASVRRRVGASTRRRSSCGSPTATVLGGPRVRDVDPARRSPDRRRGRPGGLAAAAAARPAPHPGRHLAGRRHRRARPGRPAASSPRCAAASTGSS